MKNKIIILSYCLFLSVSLLAQSSYKFQSQEIELKIDSSLCFIQSNSKSPSDLVETKLKKQLENKNIDSFSKISKEGFLLSSRKYVTVNDIGYFSNVYYDEQETRIIILPRVSVMLKQGESIESILNTYVGKLSVEMGGGEKYILRCLLITQMLYFKLQVRFPVGKK